MVDRQSKPHPAHQLARVLFGLGAAALIALTVAGCGVNTAQAHPASGPSAGHTTQVVQKYLKILDADMQSGNFSNLSEIYTSGATVRVSGGPFGPTTTVITGITAITHFFEGLRAHIGAAAWTQDSGRELAPNVYVSYEHASLPSVPVAGRCIHVFTVDDDKIASLDWAVYA